MKFDIERALKSAIYVDGLCNSGKRRALIEEAIEEIQKNGFERFRKGYIGFKNYAGFGDQRTDCSYGTGPKHGSMVFEIGMKNRDIQKDNFEDEIYFLMAVRDFEGVEVHENGFKRILSLSAVIYRYRKAQGEADEYRNFLNFDVEAEEFLSEAEVS